MLLIELLAYLVILSMASTAFMSWLNYLQRQHLSTELSQLQMAFLGAQQFAIASGRTVFICLATSDYQCTQNKADATQWLIHHDISQPTSPATVTILQTLPRDTKVSLEGRWQVWRVGRDGLMRSWGSWLLCSGSNGAKVTINRGLNFASTPQHCET
ncbi:pilus assembly FimT family protein [Umboniibacter marinipuniceus]|uniref:Type II secretion system protein H n=1 Tax=Umboniibacter marinipuniceus TaxID=569599 RepID=A0A3L9ZZU4_9GAMM|nr:type II secretion system protein [Umboniibacter marinipuniceus]RMA78391.1 Tfp pilus assembly protein FimT [Umboniibacter marinipuniceus]